MSAFTDSFSLSEHNKSSYRWAISAFVLLAICIMVRPAGAGYGSSDFPTVPSIYVFTPGRGSVYQSGGSAGVSNIYPVEGRFQLVVNSYMGSIWFLDVDADLTETSSHLYTQDLGELFNMTDLDGTIVGSATVEFTGKTSDGTDSDIVLTLDFSGDTVYLEGEITPPSSSDYSYELDAVAVRKYGGGTGDDYNPFLIYTPKHMNTIGLNPEDWNTRFKLTADIDLSSYKGTDFKIIGYYKDESDNKPFSGVFNGDGHTISGFTYTSTDMDRIGLFGYINGDNAQIKNLGIIDPNVDAGSGDYVGSLVGQLASGVFTNCHVMGGRVVGADMVGGLVGRNGLCRPMTHIGDKPCLAGTLINCYSTSNITGVTEVGGLAGSNDGTITDCYATGNVTGDGSIGGLAGFSGNNITNCYSTAIVSGNRRIGGLAGCNWGVICGCNTAGIVGGVESIGGLVGDNNGGYITICYSLSTVDGRSIVGGLAGANGGNIDSSYSTGNITGDLYIGGLVGKNAWRISGCYSTAGVSVLYGYAGGLAGINEATGSIINSYSSGSVSGGVYVGGLLGRNDGIVMKCYAKGTVNGIGGTGGLVGDSTDQACTLFSFWDTQTTGQANSAGGVGKTTALMRTADTFLNWGVCSTVGTWTINEAVDYPRLLWENQAGNIIEAIYLTDLLTGIGTEDSPFLVYTAEELNTIGLFPCEWDKHFKLMADVNISAYSGIKFNIIGFYRLPFTGIFDGNNHVISNFTYSSNSQSYVGLFGCVDALSARIKNLGIVNPVIDAATKNYVGPLAGCLKEGTITNCYASNVNIHGGNSVAGLVGYNQGTIADSYSTGDVHGDVTIGGLAGNNYRGTIQSCHSTGIVTGNSNVGGLTGDNDGTITGGYSASSVSANSLAGGLAGNNSGSIENAYSTGQTTGFEKIGGLAGGNNGTLTKCYSTGNVNGDKSIGGLAGFNLDATITSCHATGNVNGRLSAGGLVGHNSGKASITDCYSTNSVAGYEWVGGLVGRNDAIVATSYSASNVSGTMDVGGLVGWNFGQASITNCYSSGSVLAYEWVGGLVGTNGSTITKCYSSALVTGTRGTTGGLAGLNYGSVSGSFWDTQVSVQATSAGGTGKTTAQMKTRSTFTGAGWDFVGETANGTKDIWRITEGQSYPKLSWEPI